ncbi:hypothetical protein ACWC4D_39755 [Streptomyces sp. NPDC001288]
MTRKQRHTAQRIYDRLVEDHGADDIGCRQVALAVPCQEGSGRDTA